MTIKNYLNAAVPAYVHIMGWWGSPSHSHPRGNYRSDDVVTVSRQLGEIQGWGFDGTILDWYGDGYNHRLVNRTALRLLAESEHRGMQFGISIDVGALKNRPDKSISTNNEMLALIEYIEAAFTSSPAYMTHSDGKPVIFEFGVETLPAADAIQWNSIMSQKPNIHFIHRNVGGFTTPGSGSYGWIDAGLPYLKDYYARAKTPSLSKLCYGSIFSGFDNRKVNADGSLVVPDTAVWPGETVKVIPANNGQTFLDTIALTNQFVADGGRLAGVVLNTYNDHEEGSGVEGGINASLVATLSGNVNAAASATLVNGAITFTPKTMFKF